MMAKLDGAELRSEVGHETVTYYARMVNRPFDKVRQAALGMLR